MGCYRDDLVSRVALTKVNVNINPTNERGKKQRDFYFHVLTLAVVQAWRIPIRIKLWWTKQTIVKLKPKFSRKLSFAWYLHQHRRLTNTNDRLVTTLRFFLSRILFLTFLSFCFDPTTSSSSAFCWLIIATKNDDAATFASNTGAQKLEAYSIFFFEK